MKRAAEDGILQVGKKKARRLRQQTPEQKLLIEFRRKLETCMKENDVPGALRVYEEIKIQKIQPSSYMFQMILSLIGNAKNVLSFHRDAFRVHEDFKNMTQSTKLKVDETSYSALVKICSRAKDFKSAHEIIEEMETSNVAPKLRTFSSLLEAYSEEGNLEKSLWVYDKIKKHDIEPVEADFMHLLSACTKKGSSDDFYHILDEYIDCILQPSPSAWKIFQEWFGSEAAMINGKHWKCTKCTIEEDGLCRLTGDRLQSLELSDKAEKELLEKIESLVQTDEKRIKQWDEFKNWLDEYGPFDVVIDAANVGYFNQNYEGAGFTYSQIERMLEFYEEKKKKVLIVLHKRRASDAQVPLEFRGTIAKWKESNLMFNCLPGNNDDWYWLYAAFKFGGRTLMVTNDEMRDHHFQMIHNKSFVRWKERHQAHYAIHGRTVKVTEPTFYSKRPQKVNSNWYFPSNESSTWLCVQLDR